MRKYNSACRGESSGILIGYNLVVRSGHIAQAGCWNVAIEGIIRPQNSCETESSGYFAYPIVDIPV